MQMRPQTATRAAWGIGLLCIGLVGASAVLLALDLPAFGSTVPLEPVGFLTVVIPGALGVLIVTRRSRNPIGWLLLAIGLVNALYAPLDLIAIRGLLTGTSTKSWVEWVAWVWDWAGGWGPCLLSYLVL